MPVWELPYASADSGYVDLYRMAQDEYPHEVQLRVQHEGGRQILPYDDAFRWCEARFGEKAPKRLVKYKDGLWIHFGMQFMFRESDHAIEFKVRWG